MRKINSIAYWFASIMFVAFVAMGFLMGTAAFAGSAPTEQGVKKSDTSTKVSVPDMVLKFVTMPYIDQFSECLVEATANTELGPRSPNFGMFYWCLRTTTRSSVGIENFTECDESAICNKALLDAFATWKQNPDRAAILRAAYNLLVPNTIQAYTIRLTSGEGGLNRSEIGDVLDSIVKDVTDVRDTMVAVGIYADEARTMAERMEALPTITDSYSNILEFAQRRAKDGSLKDFQEIVTQLVIDIEAAAKAFRASDTIIH